MTIVRKVSLGDKLHPSGCWNDLDGEAGVLQNIYVFLVDPLCPSAAVPNKNCLMGKLAACQQQLEELMKDHATDDSFLARVRAWVDANGLGGASGVDFEFSPQRSLKAAYRIPLYTARSANRPRTLTVQFVEYLPSSNQVVSYFERETIGPGRVSGYALRWDLAAKEHANPILIDSLPCQGLFAIFDDFVVECDHFSNGDYQLHFRNNDNSLDKVPISGRPKGIVKRNQDELVIAMENVGFCIMDVHTREIIKTFANVPAHFFYRTRVHGNRWLILSYENGSQCTLDLEADEDSSVLELGGSEDDRFVDSIGPLVVLCHEENRTDIIVCKRNLDGRWVDTENPVLFQDPDFHLDGRVGNSVIHHREGDAGNQLIMRNPFTGERERTFYISPETRFQFYSDGRLLPDDPVGVVTHNEIWLALESLEHDTPLFAAFALPPGTKASN